MTSAEWSYMSGLDQYKAVVPVIKPKVQAFEPGAELVPGVVKAVEIKGHTPGHSGYRITSGPESLLYVGDSMHHYIVSVQKPEWDHRLRWRQPGRHREPRGADQGTRGQRRTRLRRALPVPGSRQDGAAR
jgi:glyoxylase-like metal-dependent hydrolase (beta-lactamase superfamily II)